MVDDNNTPASILRQCCRSEHSWYHGGSSNTGELPIQKESYPITSLSQSSLTHTLTYSGSFRNFSFQLKKQPDNNLFIFNFKEVTMYLSYCTKCQGTNFKIHEPYTSLLLWRTERGHFLPWGTGVLCIQTELNLPNPNLHSEHSQTSGQAVPGLCLLSHACQALHAHAGPCMLPGSCHACYLPQGRRDRKKPKILR